MTNLHLLRKPVCLHAVTFPPADWDAEQGLTEHISTFQSSLRSRLHFITPRREADTLHYALGVNSQSFPEAGVTLICPVKWGWLFALDPLMRKHNCLTEKCWETVSREFLWRYLSLETYTGRKVEQLKMESDTVCYHRVFTCHVWWPVKGALFNGGSIVINVVTSLIQIVQITWSVY